MPLLPQRADTGFTLAGFLILAALGTFLWKGAPLESVRPSSEQGGWYERKFAQQVPARLWQDPFRAVYAHEQAIRSGDATASYIRDPMHTIGPHSGEGTPPVYPVDLTILMVMVSPGSYAELEERRRRRRYAVLSALGEENFVPRNPEALNVFYHPRSTSTSKSVCEAKTQNLTTLTEACYSIPYEWYDYEGPRGVTTRQRQVLIFWLNESQFVDAPLASTHTFLNDLLPQGSWSNVTLRVNVLGPARSDALRNLVNHTDDLTLKRLRCDSGLADFNIISSTATVADADLIGKWSVEKDSTQHGIAPLTALNRKINSFGCENSARTTDVLFLRTIQSDEALIEKLTHELRENRTISNTDDFVVLISEWDTYFGRFLPRAFTKHFCKSASNCKNVLRYSYQRGIDGIAAASNTSQADTQTDSANAYGLAPTIDLTGMRRPAGTAQFDYLRRLATEIREKDRALRLGNGHGVRAVVLLGSDVYDKLLILRALKPELPGAVFATTDLDAHLMHPAEYNWTRGLIVASTYDLLLSPNLLDLPNTRMATMPFRDSYQTSVYLATRLIFNSDLRQGVIPTNTKTEPTGDPDAGAVQRNVYERIPPQLMEIGRQRLVHLPESNRSTTSWNLVGSENFAFHIAVGLVTIAVLGIFAFHQLRPKSGRAVFVLVGLLLLFILLGLAAILNQKMNGEPLNIVAGASIWPTEYIRVFSIVLALVFIWSAIHRLHNSWLELAHRYFWRKAKPVTDGVTIHTIWQNLVTGVRHPAKHIQRLTRMQVAPVLMLFVLFLVMRLVMPLQLPLIGKLGLLIGVWVMLLAFWWATIYGYIWKDIRVNSINRWSAECMPDDAAEMWRTYGEYGAGTHRFLRTIAYILIYFAFGSILFAILGPPSSPCRGTLACGIDRAVLGISVLSMLVLLFLVVDAARLCICWVDSLRERTLDWSNTRKPEFVQRLRLPDSHAVAWMQIHLIGERTAEVTRLIYYPVIVILLLLLARSTYFDNWDFPQALAIIIGLNFIIALGGVVRLNFVAQSVRDKLLRDLLEEKLAADRKPDVTYEPSASERQELINQLQQLRIGAYLRVWDQPPVRATLMLLGGVALTYAEYLTVLVR